MPIEEAEKIAQSQVEMVRMNDRMEEIEKGE